MENKLIVSKRGRSFGRLLNLNFAGKNFSCKKYVRNLLSLLSGLFYFVSILKAYPSACLFSISSVMKAHIFCSFLPSCFTFCKFRNSTVRNLQKKQESDATDD